MDTEELFSPYEMQQVKKDLREHKMMRDELQILSRIVEHLVRGFTGGCENHADYIKSELEYAYKMLRESGVWHVSRCYMDVQNIQDEFKKIVPVYEQSVKENKRKTIEERYHPKSVYVMLCENGEVKIGVSNNVANRKLAVEKQFNTLVVRCKYTKPICYPYKMENIVHRHFSKYRLHHEFFSVDFKEAWSYVSKLQNLALFNEKLEVE